MAEKKKYYWLKLKRDFFKRHDIRIVESMPNGKDYILFYLKLLLESIDHEGTLRFSETIPYNEQMLSVVTNTNIDTVRSAMKLFIELNMMTVFDDQTIYMNEVDKLIGSETNWARQKREQRLGVDNVHQLSTSCPPEKDKEKYKDTDTEVEVVATPFATDCDTTCAVILSMAQEAELIRIMGETECRRYIEKLWRFMRDKGAKVKDHYATILKWYEEDKAKRKTTKAKYNDFDTDKALDTALRRSYDTEDTTD